LCNKLVYASPTPGVNARFCRDDDVPLVGTERTEVDDLHSPQQDHRANVRASILGDLERFSAAVLSFALRGS